jgi:hypothetical protein
MMRKRALIGGAAARLLGLVLLPALLLLPAGGARAEPIPARDTARLLAPGSFAVGLFNPLQIGLAPGIEIDTGAVPWLLLSPNAGLRVHLGDLGGVTFAGEYGFSIPTGAMRILQGYLFPTWATSNSRAGVFFVPSVGISASGGGRGVLTGRLDTSVGIPLGRNDARPLETYAPVELLFAPALNGYRSRVGAAYDFALLDWLRARGEANVYLIGKSPFPPRSPLYFSAQLGLDIGLGQRVRLTPGVIWYNSDQRATAVTPGADGRLHRAGVRSNDFFPTFDLIFRSR